MKKNLNCLIGLFLLLLIVHGAGAVSVTVSPLWVKPGDTITVTIQGLADGSDVTMNWEVFIDEPGDEFSWDVVGLAFPINLNDADFRIENQNTATNKVVLKNIVPNYGTRELTLSGQSVNGIWSASHENDFINGSWPVIHNEGAALSGKNNVLSLVQWHGTKGANPDISQQTDGGPDDFSIPVAFDGFDNGWVKFTITVDGIAVVTETVTIGSPQSRTGNLYVTTIPGGADIYFDGVYWGKTPGFVRSIPPGKHHLLLTKEGYSPYEREVWIKEYGFTVLAGIRLSGSSGSVVVYSIPLDADVYLDSEFVGKTPITLTGIQPGYHTLRLSKEGYHDYQKDFNLIDGKKEWVIGYLRPEWYGPYKGNNTSTINKYIADSRENGIDGVLGSLFVYSVPLHADVYLDNECVGTTPVTLTGIQPGTHVIWISKDGYLDFYKEFFIDLGDVERIIGKLQSDKSGSMVQYMHTSTDSNYGEQLAALSGRERQQQDRIEKALENYKN